MYEIDTPWWKRAVFYHIHTLGFCGAPERNDFTSPAVERLEAVVGAAGHIRRLGCTAVYLGPLFESTSHGYDTVDHYHVDRRLGNNETLRRVVERLHDEGLRVVLDGVFNHSGRDHFAFHDLRQRGENSPFRFWYRGLDFSADNRFGDGFSYRGWEGHDELPEFELGDPGLREHLLGAAARMIDEFGIDGLRLDVAYALPKDFLRELSAFARSRREDFFLLGEMIHGDYRAFADETGLDSLTNYQGYKALWSSHNDENYYEIAHTLGRLFTGYGAVDGAHAARPDCGSAEGAADRVPSLYNFADNHDVDRVATKLDHPRHLFPLYALLFTMPGIPSVYYGSEFGIEAVKDARSDASLRPSWREITEGLGRKSEGERRTAEELRAFIGELALRRSSSAALQRGRYRQLHLDHTMLVFERRIGEEAVVAAVNGGGEDRVVSTPGGEVLEMRVPACSYALMEVSE